jgi:hypothetical protein
MNRKFSGSKPREPRASLSSLPSVQSRRSFIRRSALFMPAIFIPRLIHAQSVLTADGLATYGTNALAGGGGGGGSGYTLIDHIVAAGSTGTTTTGNINSTGANLLVAGMIIGSGSVPNLVDSKSNSWTTALAGWNNRMTLFYCLSPGSVGSGHNLASNNLSGAIVWFAAFAKSGGSPGFDALATGNVTANWQSSLLQCGSISPASANDLFVSFTAFDVGTGAGDNCDSSFVALDTPAKNTTTGLGLDVSYKIKSSDSTAENPGWRRGAANNSDAWARQMSFT